MNESTARAAAGGPSRTRGRGFTLVEVLIALTVMLALVAMAAGVFTDQIDESKLTIRETNLRAIRLAIQAFYNDFGRYPYNGQDSYGNVVHFLDNSTSELVQGVHAGFGTYPDSPGQKGRRSRYLREIPTDPTTGRPDWILVPADNDGDWRPGAPIASWLGSVSPGTAEWGASKGNSGGDDLDNDLIPSLISGVPGHPDWEGRPEPHVDEDPIGNGDEDGDGVADEDPPDVKDVRSRMP